MIRPRIVCITGGSGSGKTTLAEGIAKRLGDRVSLLHLDDYQKTSEHVPLTASGRRNYDHPDAIDFGRFVNDVADLANGKDISVTRREKRRTMDAGVAEGEAVIVQARPFVIVEGYLAMWNPMARSRYGLSIFLDLPHDERLGRRRWAKDPQYVTEVLKPMHDLYVEPAKAQAHLVIPVRLRTEEQVLEIALTAILIPGD